MESGEIPSLSKAKLKQLGEQIKFYPGWIDMVAGSQKKVNENREWNQHGITVEHYIVTTGIADMVRGSMAAKYVSGIWGCEYSENDGIINQIVYTIDNTTKTRALFEINKGVNINPSEIQVNTLLPKSSRRIPFENMIYIADGPSDIPAFSVTKREGGLSYAVYDESNEDAFEQADRLLSDGRIHMYGPADYQEGSQTYRWLTMKVGMIARRIILGRRKVMQNASDGVPGHFIGSAKEII